MTLGKFNKADVIVLAWWLSDLFYKLPNVPFVSLTNKIVWIITFISILYIPISIRSKPSPPFIKGSVLFFILVVLYGLWHVLFGESLYYSSLERVVAKTENLVGVLTSLAPFYLLYILSVRNNITERQLRLWSLLFLCNAIITYFVTSFQVMLLNDVESFTNNTAYEFVALLPFVLFWRNNKVVYFLYQLVILYFVLYSHKRGAILVSMLICLFYLYVYMKEQRLKLKHKFILPIILIATIYGIMNIFATDENLARRVAEGDSSGRDYIYVTLWNAFWDSPSLFTMLFGHGADATIGIAGNFAHNDWLELLTCQGLLGIFCYIYYYYSFAKSFTKCRILIIKYELIAIFIMVLIMSIYSMSYMSYRASIIVCLGYAMGQVNNKNRILNL